MLLDRFLPIRPRRVVAGAGLAALALACGAEPKSRSPLGDAPEAGVVIDSSTVPVTPTSDAGAARDALIFVGGEAGGPEIKPPIGDHAVHQGTLPPDVERAFADARVDPGPGPALVYPTPETMFPPNIARILFQWTASSGNVFRVHFETTKGKLDVYTDGVHATCAKAETGVKCWESAADTLLPYLDAALGGSITFRISALDAAMPGTVWQSPIYAVHVAPKRVGGAIYYWSTTARGVRRGTLDGREAADYLTPDEAKGQCVACHTLSRSGKRLSIALPGDLLGLADVVDTVPPVTFGPSTQGFSGENIAASWATFSPDETRLIVAGQGVLSVRDARTAKMIGAAIALPAKMTGSMPDWAPDGKHLVFAASLDATPDRVARHLQGSSIAWLSAAGEGFSGLEIIAASRGVVSDACVGKESYANPMFSPDSRWLAFSRGDCESEADPSAEIILTAAQPNAPKLPLTRANTAVGGKVLARLQNGMPTWAPSHDASIGWIAFTSARDYGLVLAQGSKIGVGMHQLWIAAVDLEKTASGDPSYPAFRLPAQDLTENNHRPFWTVDVLPPDWVPPDIR
jgi:WD40-like Beta Propeller Repeat